MQEPWVQSLVQEDPLEKGMATHSSILTWRIPWTEEPGRLQSTKSQRVGHDWVIDTYTKESEAQDLLFHLQTFAFVDVFASSHSSSQDRLIRIPQGSSQTLPFQKHLPWSPFPASYFF